MICLETYSSTRYSLEESEDCYFRDSISCQFSVIHGTVWNSDRDHIAQPHCLRQNGFNVYQSVNIAE